MSQKYLVYILLWFLFQLLIEINCQTSLYKLKERRRHTATFFDNKLYILGGADLEEAGKDFFYIDFSVPFNTQNLVVKDLSNINTVPAHFSAGSAISGPNNDTLFLCGGVPNITVSKMEDVYTYNPQSNSWNIPKIAGKAPIILDCSAAAMGQNGKMYLWSGIGSNLPILNTISLAWEQGSSVGAPQIGLDGVSTSLPDNKIIYLDDFNNLDNNLAQVYIYDTVSDNWTTKTTLGTSPPKRSGMSIVLGLDGQRVIVFGGLDFSTSKQPLYELSLTNFEWRIPKTSGPIPASRSAHKANVIGNYMVISFGLGYRISTTENDILLLDISNVNEYIWTNEFKPGPLSSIKSSTSVPPVPSAPKLPPNLSPLSTQTSSQQSENNNNNLNISGVVIGSLIGGALLSFLGSLLYRWSKKRKSDFNENKAENNNYYPGRVSIQQPAPASLINNNMNNINRNESNYNNIQAERENYYPGQEIVEPSPVANNEIQELKQEIQDLRQIILQNNK